MLSDLHVPKTGQLSLVPILACRLFIWTKSGWLLIGLLAMELESKYSKFHKKKGFNLKMSPAYSGHFDSDVLLLSCCKHWPNSQIPQCTSPISHNGPFRTRSEWCIVGYGTGALWDLLDWSIAVQDWRLYYWNQWIFNIKSNHKE